jgi:flagellin-like protein
MSAFMDIASNRQLVKEERGITGLETAIVLIAFVVVSSVFAFSALSTGLFSSDKAKEAIQAGLNEAQGTLEIRGVKGTATLTATTSQAIGTGDGSTTTFSMANTPIIPGSQTIKVAGTTQTQGTAYSVNFDTGLITFTSAPANAAAITADYTYYVIGSVKVTLANAAGGNPVDLTGGKTIIAYLDPDTVGTNITDYTLVKYGSADADNLLEAGELFELSVDVSTYGLTDYDDFILQIKPGTGAVLSIGRTIPARVETIMDLG